MSLILGIQSGAGLGTIKKIVQQLIDKVNAMQLGIAQDDYADVVSYLNPLAATELVVGQDIYVLTIDTPDLWISEVHANSVPYTYVDDDTLLSDINTGNGKLQIGYYSISIAESVGVGVFELLSNKSSNVDTDKTSTTKYATVKAIYDWAVGKFIDLAKIVTTWTATTLDTNIPSEKLVKDSLNLKADITPANGSTSALRALFVARGATYNGDGTYSLGGLTDLTESQMMIVYSHTSQLINSFNLTGVFQNTTIRTCYNTTISRGDIDLQSCSKAFSYCTLLESIVDTSFYSFASSNYISMFNGCVKLHTLNIIYMGFCTNPANVSNMLNGCAALVTCYLKALKVNFSFAWSPLLSLASLQYLVTNRANGTSRITITVHATVWGYLNDAVNYPTWNALLVNAVNNQYIDFASA